MAKRQRRGNRQGPAAATGAAQRPGGGAPAGAPPTGFGPVRDAVRRDIEQATQALAFAEQLLARLDGQRRLFIDFPRAMEELRSGALERVAAALGRLYEGGPGVHDLSRFLRDLPLALSHLAAAEAARRREASAPQPPQAAAVAASASAEGEAPSPFEATAATGSATDAPAAASEATASALNADADAPGARPGEPEAPPPEAAASPAGAAGAPSAASAPPPPAAGSAPAPGGGPVSPRLELRAKLLAAAPQLGRAAQSYRRNVATVRRATAPRRAPGPWRSDREVLEQASRAVEFARQIFDAYAEAWADAPLPKGLHQMAAEETDRFLAWTQLVRYVELARTQPPSEGSSRAAAAAAGSDGEGESTERPEDDSEGEAPSGASETGTPPSAPPAS